MKVTTVDGVLWRGRAKGGHVVLSLVSEGFACTTRLCPNEITHLVGQLLTVAAEARSGTSAPAGPRYDVRRRGTGEGE